MAVVLLYNIGGEKLRKIRTALLRLGLSGRTVSSEEYGHPIGFLAGLEGFGHPKTAEVRTSPEK